MIKKIEFDYKAKTTPLGHQIEAIDYIKKHSVVPLFDEQGLGKSKMVIDALCANIEERLIDGALIVCKKTLLRMWENEVKKHSHLFPIVLTGTKQKRGKSLVTYGHFYIVNYELLIQELDLIRLLLKHKNFAVVLDESQIIKNPRAKITKALHSIKDLAKKRIIITGTPITNKPDDIWSQFYFLDNGKLLGDDYATFSSKYKLRLKGKTSLSGYERSLRELQRNIDSVSLRRTKGILELPEKIFSDSIVNLAQQQRKIYETAKNELYYEIKRVDENILIEEIENYLVKLLRLTQIASNPAMLIENYVEIPAKFAELDKMVRQIVQRSEKVIIWTSFRTNVRSLRKRYSDVGALMLYGQMSIDDRNKAIDKFMADEKHKVLVANPAAAKVGLTLTSANNAIYVDRTFNMDDYLQSQDRIHRIGQSKKCHIVKLIAKDTIDEYTDEILEKKELVAKFALGDTDNIDLRRKCLSKKDLLRILGRKA